MLKQWSVDPISSDRRFHVKMGDGMLKLFSCGFVIIVSVAAYAQQAAVPTGKIAANGQQIYKIGKKECAPPARTSNASMLNAASKARGEKICSPQDEQLIR